MMKPKLLAFHRAVAPYRIDFFNGLWKHFDAHIYFEKRYILFDLEQLEAQLHFPVKYISSWDYISLLRKHCPDIVFTGEFGKATLIILLYKWLTRGRFKVVSVCDDSIDMIEQNNDFTYVHRVLRRVVPRWLDNLILSSSAVKSWYQRQLGKGVYFPIIQDGQQLRALYQSVLPQSRLLDQQYQLEGKRVFLFVGRLVPLKNVGCIIRAFQTLNDPDSRLVIVGSGEEEAALQQLAEDTPHILFTGRLEGQELYAWYNLASCFILASWQEAFGAVVNEALLAGCPCLVSERAGASELIVEGNGAVFNPSSTEELTELMHLQPISYNLGTMRKSLMPFTFAEKFNQLLHSLL